MVLKGKGCGGLCGGDGFVGWDWWGRGMGEIGFEVYGERLERWFRNGGGRDCEVCKDGGYGFGDDRLI